MDKEYIENLDTKIDEITELFVSVAECSSCPNITTCKGNECNDYFKDYLVTKLRKE